MALKYYRLKYVSDHIKKTHCNQLVEKSHHKKSHGSLSMMPFQDMG